MTKYVIEKEFWVLRGEVCRAWCAYERIGDVYGKGMDDERYLLGVYATRREARDNCVKGSARGD